MHPKTELKSLSRIFVWMGLSSVQPFTRENSRFHNILIVLPIILQIAIIIFETWFTLAHPIEILHSATAVGTFTDIIQVFGLLMAGTIQIFENIWKGDIDQSIKQSMDNFDRGIFAAHIRRNHRNCSFWKKRSLKPYLINRSIYLFLVALAIDIAIVITLKQQPKQDIVWKQSILVREFTANMIRIGLIQAILHFHWIQNRLVHLQTELYQLIQTARLEEKRFKKNSKKTLEKLSKLKSYYARLWKITKQINERFNWTIFSTISIYFATTCIGVYWVYMRIKFNRWSSLWQSCFIHVPLPLAIIILVHEIESWGVTIKQISKTIFVNTNFNSKFAQKIRNFAYMIHSCSLRISVMNLFELNYTIYAKMVSVITTYIFLLVSMRPPNYD